MVEKFNEWFQVLRIYRREVKKKVYSYVFYLKKKAQMKPKQILFLFFFN